MDVDRTRAVLAALEQEGVEYAILGAVALNLQGLARATEDLLGDYPAVQVYKYRDVSEMEDRSWREAGDPGQRPAASARMPGSTA